MLLPLGDAPNFSNARPWVNYGLIAANVVVYVWAVMTHGSGAAYQDWVLEWGFIPVAPRLETFFTSMFMHGGLLHLAGNMLFLWIFGDNVEGRLGHVGYLFAYLACGLAAVLLFRALDPGSTVPMVGASGAIFGVEGFYFLAFPKNRVRVLFWILIIWWTWIPARYFLGLTFVLNLVYMLSPQGAMMGGGVAYAAHVGGFVCGAGLALALYLTRPRTEPLPAFRAHGRGRASEGLAAARRALEGRRYDEAAERLQEIIRRDVHDPQAPVAALELGLLLSRVLGRPEAARPTLTFAARMHPESSGRAAALAELERLT